MPGKLTSALPAAPAIHHSVGQPASEYHGDAPVAAQTGGGFDSAIRWLKEGRRCYREGWNGRGMFIFLVPGSTFKVNRPPLLGIYAEGTEVRYHAHIDMKTAQGYVVPWLASQADVLSDDWYWEV